MLISRRWETHVVWRGHTKRTKVEWDPDQSLPCHKHFLFLLKFWNAKKKKKKRRYVYKYWDYWVVTFYERHYEIMCSARFIGYQQIEVSHNQTAVRNNSQTNCRHVPMLGIGLGACYKRISTRLFQNQWKILVSEQYLVRIQRDTSRLKCRIMKPRSGTTLGQLVDRFQCLEYVRVHAT